MPNYQEYQKSVSREFKAYESRVRNLIDNVNWGEEGRYKEIILMNYLKRVLPKNISVGTGFVRNKNRITTQIDIIIYDNSFPLLFSEGDFIVATSQNIVGIIEVKSNIRACDLCSIIDKANANGEIISSNRCTPIFNGIFSFNSEDRPEGYIQKMHSLDFSLINERQHFNQVFSNKLHSCVNHIALGDRFFIKLWPYISVNEFNAISKYSMYDLEEELAFSYFLSNLQEIVARKSTGEYLDELPEELKSFYYPIREGKEAHLVGDVILNNFSY